MACIVWHCSQLPCTTEHWHFFWSSVTCSYMHSSHMVLVSSFRGFDQPLTLPWLRVWKLTLPGVDSTKTWYPAAFIHLLPLLHESMGRTRRKGSLGESLGPRLGEGGTTQKPHLSRGATSPTIQVEIIHYDSNFVKISRANTYNMKLGRKTFCCEERVITKFKHVAIAMR